jgi:hypothetical protein
MAGTILVVYTEHSASFSYIGSTIDGKYRLQYGLYYNIAEQETGRQ